MLFWRFYDGSRQLEAFARLLAERVSIGIVSQYLEQIYCL